MMLSATEFISVLSAVRGEAAAAEGDRQEGREAPQADRQKPDNSQMVVLDIRCVVAIQSSAVRDGVCRSSGEVQASGGGLLPTSIQIEPGALACR